MKTLAKRRPLAAILTLAAAFAMPPAALAPGAGSSLPGSLSAQEPPDPPDLASLFDLGTLVLDTNGDSVPDFVNVALILGDDPSAAVLAAAGEVAARLGFETMPRRRRCGRWPAATKRPIRTRRPIRTKRRGPSLSRSGSRSLRPRAPARLRETRLPTPDWNPWRRG